MAPRRRPLFGARTALELLGGGAPSRRRVAVGAAAGLAIVAGAAWAALRFDLESTDDAQIDAEMIAVAARVGGVVTLVAVADNQAVKAGDVLLELDAEPARARLTQAEAALAKAEASVRIADLEARMAETNARAGQRIAAASLGAASAGALASGDQRAEANAKVEAASAVLAQARAELERARRLAESGSVSEAHLEQSSAAFETARASLAQAEAHARALRFGALQAERHVQEASARAEQMAEAQLVVDQARARADEARAVVAQLRAARDLAALDLSYTRLLAPQDGVVSRKGVGVGQTLAAGTPVVQLVPARPPWVTANFKETQVAKMGVGQPVTVTIDAFAGVTLRGTVESFAAGTGARFALLPPDNATGNFTKVVQRVPVRVRLDDVPASLPLRPGMSVVVTVDTGRR